MVYCADFKCSHSVAVLADQWPDERRLSDLEPRFVCTTGGKRGAQFSLERISPKMIFWREGSDMPVGLFF
jgi:hypothetical protein